MSCEAKVWWEKDGWHGIHDGECSDTHHESEYGLSTLLREIEICYFGEVERDRMRWYFRTYPGNTQTEVGLVGYTT